MTRTLPPVDAEDGSDQRLGRGLLLLMAAATGLSVAGNYYAHPLLDVIGRDLRLTTTVSGLIVTAAQVGYTLGLLLLVPLGDLVERRRLVTVLYATTGVAVLVVATAPNGGLLLAGAMLAALASVGAQVVVPIAVTLAAPADRGKAVGSVMTGLLLGMLLARTVSGWLSELGGWRTVFFAHAAAMVLMAALLRRFLPRLETRGTMSYPALIRSTVGLFRTQPLLRWRATIVALSFASFTAMWTALTFLLGREPFTWSEATIGLFGLVGAVGAVTATVAGRLADRGLVQAVSGAGSMLLLLAWLPLGLGGQTLALLVTGVVMIDMAQQAVLNSSQNVLYALDPAIRNRLNSAFMTLGFAGGAAGSAMASVVWPRAGWTGVCLVSAALAAGALVLWTLERLTARRRA
jgi:predicted MFS family arabinose efflux permease